MRTIWINAVMILALVTSCFADDIMVKAKPYLPTVVSLVHNIWPAMPKKQIIPRQVQQESSWNPKATLNTKRELGRGFAQITIAYDQNHKERFNNFKNAVHIKGLREWNWRKDPYNVKYQLTYLILMDKSNYATVRPYMINDDEALKTMLVSYNAGEGRWMIRRTYAKANGIPADRWTGGLDQACKPSEKSTKIYGESLCEMVNDYPRIIFNGSDKYKDIFQ